MLSWVSGIHRSQKPPSWYENEVSLSVNTGVDNHPQETSKRRLGLLPKIRRAIEAATYASNGSFPIQETGPPSPDGEETAFEACDSPSQSVGGSCMTSASYDMSKIDDENIATGADLCDSIAPSPTASDVDSLFGVNIRDMATLDNNCKIRDDVWLLSAEDEIKVDVPPVPEELKSPSGSILSRVPVLMLPGLTDRQMRRSKEPCEAWEADAEDEEEIQFDDSIFLISETEERYNLNGANNDNCGDENRNSNIMRRLGQTRAQRLGKNLKSIWSGSDCGKRVKLAKRKYRLATKRSKKKASPVGLHSVDPLKELSKCHEKMLENGEPFTPKKAYTRIRDRIPEDVLDDLNCDKQPSVLLAISSSVSSADVASTDEASELSLPSEMFPSLSTNATTDAPKIDSHSFASDDKPVALVESESESSESQPSENQSSESQSLKSQSSESLDANDQACPVTYGAMCKKSRSKPPPAYKIMFKSAKKDTPRVVLGDEVTECDSGEEPRALYTDEGYVEAYIHPKSSSRSNDSPSSLNHVFHSELSTLYEVSSSLESASFNTASGSAAYTEATSMCATAGHSRSGGPPLRVASSTASDSSSSGGSNQENCPLPSGRTNIRKESIHNKVNNNKGDCFVVDDREVQMRWEFSMGSFLDDSGTWRQPQMALMNTEEMSNGYVAEI